MKLEKSVNLSVNLSVNSSFQQILVLWTLFVNLKALNTIGRHVPNVLVYFNEPFPLSEFFGKIFYSLDYERNAEIRFE